MTPLSEESLREKCADIQILTGLDDTEWETKFGNKNGLYGFLNQDRQAWGEQIAEQIDEKIRQAPGTGRPKISKILGETAENYRSRTQGYKSGLLVARELLRQRNTSGRNE